MGRRFSWLALAWVGVICVTACGGGGSGGGSGPGSQPAASATAGGLAQDAGSPGGQDPCTLTTRSAVTAAFGGKVGPGKIDKNPAFTACVFEVSGSNLGIDGQVAVNLFPGQTARSFALAKKEIPGEVDVPGIGDDALYNIARTSVEILKGNVVANVQAVFLNPGGTPPPPAKVKADTLALAKSVAAGL